ncbi:MAG: RNA polymerase sigma factor FliA [Methylophilaceae bacterium]|nr:RNA polymerase sigma factor FliA [Methylophilaceae bacterium]
MQERSVLAYAPLVKRIAHQLAARLPASVEVDDLMQAGMLGLLAAMEHFDENQGAQFETYASQRIRGAMLDALREIDWVPRSVRKHAREIEQTIAVLQQKLGHAPTEQEIADAMGIELTEYQSMLADARGHQLLYYEDFHDENGDPAELDIADTRPTPLETILDSGLHQALIQAIKELPEREKMVMAMYYQEDLNLKEIGAILGVSESRVCQIHSQAVMRLRSKLRDWIS